MGEVLAAAWSQVLVLQWEGGLHLKSLRDFSGCRRSNDISAHRRARAATILQK
ncbi:hypothetical protein LJC08_00715 [Methanimicrococcus sp. OttesenSCG-928-J09]|nr:hypothetical protein [Methanimicrococcus sp. OttesenSCG-928-J09]